VDTRLHRPVAIKAVVHSGTRFLEEAEHLAQFAHVGIVRVYELLVENATAYVIMERLSGRSLRELLNDRGGRLPVDEALRIVDAVGAALVEVHRRGLLHRDLKPDNIVIADDGRPVLVDFGAARLFDPHGSTTMTQLVTPG